MAGGRFTTTQTRGTIMTAEPGKESGHELVEAFIDGLIHDILTEAGQPTAAVRRSPMTALIETAITSPPSKVSRTSMIERLMLSQAIASELADALAPALAEALTPEIMKALEHYTTGEPPGKEEAPAVGAKEAKESKERAQKTETK
jgi:hypothetical protein